MALPKDLPYRDDLKEAGYDTKAKILEASDDELATVLESDEIAEVKAFYGEDVEDEPDTTGPTGGKLSNQEEVTKFPTSGAASDPSNKPNTASDIVLRPDTVIKTETVGGGNANTEIERRDVVEKGHKKLAKGVFQNARGTVSVTSEADQPDVVSKEQADYLRKASAERLRDRMRDIFG